MKNLVLGALFAVASVSTGCTSSDGDDGGGGGGGDTSLVHVSWSFSHLETNEARSCPTGFGTAVVKSQVVDVTSHLGTGTDFTDLYNCSDMSGTIELPAGAQYLVWVEFTNDSQTSKYAESNSNFVDTDGSLDPIKVEIFDDGGYFFFTWDLADSSGHLLNCADAGVTANGSVEAVATSIANSSYFKNDKFTCEDHYGTTDPLLADDYTVSIDAEGTDGGGAIGQAPTLNNKEITAPNGLTDLGHAVITIQ